MKYIQKIGSLLEKWAITKIFLYLRDDKYINYSKEKAFIYAFIIGFLTTLSMVYIEESINTAYTITYSEDIVKFLLKWLLIGIIIGIFSAIEIYLLYLLSFKTLIHLYKQYNIKENDFFMYDFTYSFHAIMARIALESDEIAVEQLDVDLYRTKKKQIYYFQQIVYKLKIILSNAIAKIILRKFLVNMGARNAINYIAAPVTGLWDVLVLYFIIIRMEFILKSSKKIDNFFVKKQKLYMKKNKKFKEILIRIISNAVSDESDYHPNYKYILTKLYELNISLIDFKNIKNMHNLELLKEELNELSKQEKIEINQFLEMLESISKKGKLAFIKKLEITV